MNAVERYARYRAPAESGQKLVVPSWQYTADLLAANLNWRVAAQCDFFDRPLADLAQAARREVLTRARAHGSSYHATNAHNVFIEEACRRPLVVTGHQPGLVHPGVWLKNFASAAIAGRCGGRAVHIVIDADVCRTPAIFVPAGNVDAPRLALVEFDANAPPTPWEERRILDETLWRTFPERVREACSDLVSAPMLDEWWSLAVQRSEATGYIGSAIAQARHLAEIDCGSDTAELAQSSLCQTEAFRWFTFAILADLPRFASIYNDVLAGYRKRHRLRNHAHPVPDLGADGGWLEAPFWLWTLADSRRRPVFVRRSADGVLISNRHGQELSLSLSGGRIGESAVAALSGWEAAGVKLRSRALLTTMFTRLAVADLFIHGIGGAKYDEATDEICRQYFGISPPEFATISGTLRLPIAHPACDEHEPRRLRCALRELAYHPENRIGSSTIGASEQTRAEHAVADKRRWVHTPKTPANAGDRHREIAAANAVLQSLLAAERRRLEHELRESVRRARACRVLESREYSFCLFPRTILEQFLLDFEG